MKLHPNEPVVIELTPEGKPVEVNGMPVVDSIDAEATMLQGYYTPKHEEALKEQALRQFAILR